jgi:hypothetical protein
MVLGAIFWILVVSGCLWLVCMNALLAAWTFAKIKKMVFPARKKEVVADNGNNC